MEGDWKLTRLGLPADRCGSTTPSKRNERKVSGLAVVRRNACVGHGEIVFQQVMSLQINEHCNRRMKMTHHKASDHKILPVLDGPHTAAAARKPAPLGRRRALRFWPLAGLILLAGPATRADDFENIYYDPVADELVIVINYSGTNPDHQFTLNWGECQTKDDNQSELFGDLIDEQSRDAARQDYRKTVRFSLAAVDCRPATLTLRTAPRFLATVTIPASRSKR
jgi:hypothetical protein